MANPASQSLTQNQTQRLATRLSQQQIRFVRLLELNAPEIEEAVDQELQSNPALEALPGSNQDQTTESKTEEDEWVRPTWRPGSSSSADFQEYVSPEDSPTLYDYLNDQLVGKKLTPDETAAAKFIIGNLDSNGYLRLPLTQLSLDMAVNEGLDLPLPVWKKAWETVKELEPTGVGAADLRECLQLQLARLPESSEKLLATRILSGFYSFFTQKHFDKIAAALGIDTGRVYEAIALIRELNPKPGAQFETRSSVASNYIQPDFILEENDSGLTISLANRIPELTIEQSFESAIKSLNEQPGPKRRKGFEYVTDRVNNAREFIKLLTQRQQTLMKVAAAILKIQKEYFETRDIYRLRPMGLKDIMAITGFDASVVSRATAGKYIQTPWGIFPMRFFFSDTVGENGSDTDALTNRKLEAEIRDLVKKENKSKPLSDAKLQKEMAARGYDISRRTVAKYRDRLGIPIARLRRHS